MSTNEIEALRERAKELRCLYRIHEIVSRRGCTPAQTFLEVLEVIPHGWQWPNRTGARIEYLGRGFVGPGYASSGEVITETIRLGGVDVGRVEVSTTVDDDTTPAFLDEEAELLRNIAHRLGEYLEWKHTELLGDRALPATAHWPWRQTYAESLASHLDAQRFGVAAVYLGGSTEAGEAGPGSDIDLYVVCHGTDPKRDELAAWLEGWSLCLAEFAHRQTGYRFPGGIINVHWLPETPDLRHRPDLRALRVANETGSP